MQITIELNGREGADELNALAALIAALGGRAPTTSFAEAVMPEIADVPNGPITSIPASGAASPSPSTAPTADVGAPDRDSAGLPWDGRIHSESKATIGDGTWRKRRGVDEATYDAVMAELRAGHTASVGEPTPSPSTDDTPPPPVEPAATVTPAVVADNASEDVPPPPPATDGPDLSSFPKFVQAVNNKDVPAEKKSYSALNELCTTFGVAAFKDMKDRPNDWAMFYDMVG